LPGDRGRRLPGAGGDGGSPIARAHNSGAGADSVSADAADGLMRRLADVLRSLIGEVQA